MISDCQIRALSALMKAAGILCWTVCIIGLVMAWLALHGRAVELSVIGSSIGQGFHNISFSGDLINASLIQGNNSSWAIVAGGHS